jgi:lipopolysaccharide heptosyltransferase II
MILFTPALRSIREKYPNAQITLWLKQKAAGEAVRSLGLGIIIIPYYYRNVRGLFKQLLVFLKLRKTQYDIIITTFIEKGFKVRLMVRGLKAKKKLGYLTGSFTDRWFTDLLEFNGQEHEVERHFKIARVLNCPSTIQDPHWDLEDDQQLVGEFTAHHNIAEGCKLLVGLHPGSSQGLSHKRWNASKFAKAADLISEKYNAAILIFGSKEEVPLSKKIAKYVSSCKPILLSGRTTLPQTAALIKRCDCFISNDSGLMHVAAAVRTPQIALFGPTSTAKNAPRSAQAIVIDGKQIDQESKNPIENITVTDVLEAFEKLKETETKDYERKRALRSTIRPKETD